MFRFLSVNSASPSRNKLIVFVLIFGSSELLKITETGDASDPNLPSIKSKGASVTKLSLNIESQQSNLLIQGCLNNQSEYGFKLRKVCSLESLVNSLC